MGVTKSAELNKISKEIWEYLIVNGIMHTAEYLPGSQNIQPDEESRHTKNSSKWKLCPQTFARTTQIIGKPSADVFVSHVMEHGTCHAVDDLQQKWTQMCPLSFPPFSLMGKV